MADDVESTVPDAPSKKGLSRRQMIRASAIAGAAAWTAPVIIDSLASPAAAESLPPFTCNDPLGLWYAVLYSPPGGSGGFALVDRPGSSWNDTYTYTSYYGGGTCHVTSPAGSGSNGTLCMPTSLPSRKRASRSSVGLTSDPNISHNVTDQLTTSLTIQLSKASCCKITRVVAHIHQFFAPDSTVPGNDCPTDYCQEAAAGNSYFPLVSGTFPTKTVTVNPSRSADLCDHHGVHWGSPNNDSNCNSQPGGNGYSNGQPAGYLLIEFECKPEYAGQS